MDTIRIKHQKTKMIAHRGVSGLETENTYPAFVAAGNRSYFGIETDVHCTADGNFIILHDDNTERVTGASYIAEETDFQTLRSLQGLDLQTGKPSCHLHLPTLEEYIAVCRKYEKIAVLELKNPMDEASVHDLIDRIDVCGYLENVIFISFSFENLVHVRNKCPNQVCQFLFGDPDEVSIESLQRQRFDVDMYYRNLTADLVRRYHDAGIRVNCWTVNDPADAERLIGWDVDYITTNILE